MIDANLCKYPNVSITGLFAHYISLGLHYSSHTINIVISNSPISNHQPLVNVLAHHARVIQHVLRYNIIPKVDDRINNTLLLSTIKDFIMMNNSFIIAYFLIQYIKNLTIIRNPPLKEV